MAETHEIPVIDLAPLHSGSSAGLYEVAASIRRCYAEVGFAYVIEHGVPQALRERVFAEHARFHRLPLEEKLKVRVNAWHRGYLPLAGSGTYTSSVARVTRPNHCESFMVLFEPDAHPSRRRAALSGPNQWPADLTGFREAVRAYQDAMVALCRKLTAAFAIALGLDATELDPFFETPTTFLRLLHYPAQPASPAEQVHGMAPHTDYGFITVLAQDDTGGLELRLPGGQWVPVPPRPGTLLLNTGDMVARWSNDTLRSTPHGVRALGERERHAIAFFFDPDMDLEIRCLPRFLHPHEPARYEPIAYGDYLLERLNRNHDYRHGPADIQPRTSLAENGTRGDL